MIKRRPLWSLLFFFLALIFITEIFLPGFAENRLRIIFYEETDSIDELQVNIRTFPALKIFSGRMDRVIIESTGVFVDGLYIDSFNVSYQDLVLEKGSFTGINTSLNVVINEDALNEYINKKYPELGDFQLRIMPDQVLLQGSIMLFDTAINIRLSGNFVVTDRQMIYFVPEDFQLENIKIPKQLLKSYVENIELVFHLKELNIPLDIDEIKSGSAELTIIGGNQEIIDSVTVNQ
ncbi:MAG: DUF2993 domain-containing protein [Halanaerobiaceae bacterium]